MIQLLKQNSKSSFPELVTTERPDIASQALLEGKIVIIVDNSPFVLILPTFFVDFFHTPDDYYEKNINISFVRILRFFKEKGEIKQYFLPTFRMSKVPCKYFRTIEEQEAFAEKYGFENVLKVSETIE